jgi:hypothetical protein
MMGTEEGPGSRFDYGFAEPALVGAAHRDVRDLDGLERDGRPPHDALALADRRAPGRQRGPARYPLHELLRCVVVLEDHAAVEPRELHGSRDDGGEHRFQVERRADGLPDLP